jgi:tetratricopeptide (TPR) repeat protein
MGKTQLAAKFAHTVKGFDIVCWIHAHQEEAIITDLGALAHRLGLRPIADQTELRRRLWERLNAAGRWLLVYDNAESEDELRELLPPDSGGSILVTSQSPNWSTLARRRFLLPHMSKEDALAMLHQRLPARNQQELAQIAEQLGWLPLALEQAAAYMRETQCQPNRYLRQLERHFQETLRAHTPAFYRASAAATYNLARERATAFEPLSGILLELCGFFSPDAIPRDLFEAPGQIAALPPDLAEAVRIGLPYDLAISAARRFSLLTVTATSFSMHRVVQRLIRESLESGVRTRRVAAAVAMLAQAFPANPDDPGTLEASGRLQSHCISALDEAEEYDLVSVESIRLSRIVGEYQRARGSFEAAEIRLERTLAQLRNLQGDDVDPKELAPIELALARVYFRQAHLAKAKEHAVTALLLYERFLSETPAHTAASLLDLSQIQLELSEFKDALANARRSRQIYLDENGSSTELTGLSVEALGVVQWRLGQWEDAKRSLSEALDLLTAAFGPDNGIAARVQTVYGLVLRDSALGDEEQLTRAEDELRHACTVLIRAHGVDHPDTVAAAIHLADTHRRKAVARSRKGLEQSEFIDECRKIAEEFEQVMRRQPMRTKNPGRACGLVRQGHLLNHLGDGVHARELVHEARGIYIQSYGADHPYVAEALTRLIAIEYDLDNLADAERSAHEARRIYQKHYGQEHPYVKQIDAFLADPASGGRD